MNVLKSVCDTATVLVISAGALLATPAAAQSVPVHLQTTPANASLLANADAATPDTWQFDGLLYLYLPTIDGTTTFPPPVGGSSVSIDADKILSNLNMAFMGSFGLRKGHWGAFTDLMYMDLGKTQSATRNLTIGGVQLPVGVTADATFDIKATLWTVAGSYRVTEDMKSPVDVFAGARLLDLQETLRWQLSGNIGSVSPPDRAGNQGVHVANWDGIIGVKGRFALGANQTWFIPYYLDIGTGTSDKTLQAMGGIGYAFKWGELVGTYRYVLYDMKGDGLLQDIRFAGPAIGATFRF